MPRIAKLFTTVLIHWTDIRNDHDCQVEVDYTYDGETLTILSSKANTYADMLPVDFDDLVWEAVMDEADQAYAEDQADYGEYLYEMAMDRRAA